MPTYCFRTDDGEVVELPLSIAEKARMGDEITLGDGRRAVRDFMSEHSTEGPRPGTWPLYSDAAGVHPDQIPAARARAERNGVPTDFTPDGRVVFRSRKHRKEFCEVFGLYDRSGGYGDPQKRN